MRRLRARISEPGSVQYILTSATLGGPDADSEILRFAEKLCGVPFKASGIRLGTPAVTSRGMVEADMEKIAEAIDMVLSNPSDESQIAKAKEIALELCKTHSLPY